MKKNIIIALLSGISVLFLTFSLYQKSQADISTERAVKLQKEAGELLHQSKMKEYEAQQQLVRTNSELAITIQQLQIAQDELKKIKGSR
jgi:uncharacterized membrane protein